MRVAPAIELNAQEQAELTRLSRAKTTSVRLGLARALAMRPRLLLIDEVAAGLTESEVGEFIEIVRRVRNMGTTVVWIEHVIRTMLSATDRLMALAGGKVLAIGEPERVIRMPEVKRVYLGA